MTEYDAAAPRRNILDELTEQERLELERMVSDGKVAFLKRYEEWKAERAKSVSRYLADNRP